MRLMTRGAEFPLDWESKCWSPRNLRLRSSRAPWSWSRPTSRSSTASRTPPSSVSQRNAVRKYLENYCYLVWIIWFINDRIQILSSNCMCLAFIWMLNGTCIISSKMKNCLNSAKVCALVRIYVHNVDIIFNFIVLFLTCVSTRTLWTPTTTPSNGFVVTLVRTSPRTWRWTSPGTPRSWRCWRYRWGSSCGWRRSGAAPCTPAGLPSATRSQSSR